MYSMLKTNFIETCTVSEMMVFYRGNQTQASNELCLSRGTLRTWLAEGGNKLVKVVRHRDGSTISHFELINK